DASAPPRVAPRRIPARTLRRRLGHAVDAARAPWMTAQQPCERHPRAGPQAVTVERLVGIFRAGGQMPTVEADQRREGVAIDLHQPAAREARDVQDVHSAALAFAAPRFASIWLI